MPTESPSFAFDTSMKSPMLYQGSYQVMGGPDSENEVLIDTTAGRLDTLFRMSNADNTIGITRTIDDFDIGSLTDVIPEISVNAISFSISGESAAGKRGGTAGKVAGITATISDDGSFPLEIDGLSFDTAGDFVALDEGTLVIEEIVNEFDVGFKRFTIVIPSLRTAPYGDGDGLQITFSHSKSSDDDYHYPAIGANDSRHDLEIPLSDLRLVPTGNEVTYHVEGETEEITDWGVINSSDEVRGTLALSDISVQQMQATVAATTVNLTDDADDDGQIEIASDAEAEVAVLDGLSDLNDWFTSIQLTGTEMTIKLETNLPAGVELYAAIRGENARGNTVFLGGRSSYAVHDGEVENGLFTGKTGPLAQSKLIKIPIESSPDPTDPGGRTVSVVIDNSTANIDEFLNNLPTEIRFVGRARVNPDGPRQMRVTRPIELDASLDVYLPLRVAGEAIVVKDTVEADFSAIENNADSEQSLQFNEGSLEISYANGLPVGATLTLEVLDADHRSIGVAFGGDESPIVINPASVEDGAAAAPTEGRVELELSDEQLDVLGQGRYLRHTLIVQAEETDPVSLQADDTIRFSVGGSFDMRVRTP